MRKLIAAMKMSVDGKIAEPEGDVPWADAWSDDYGLTPEVDACVLEGGMCPVYGQYWIGVQAEFATETPHDVLPSTLDAATWSNTTVIRGIDEVATLKRQAGRDIYLVGGATTISGFLEAGLVDELRLIVYPLVAGDRGSLFATTTGRQRFTLRAAGQLPGGRVSLVYELERANEVTPS